MPYFVRKVPLQTSTQCKTPLERESPEQQRGKLSTPSPHTPHTVYRPRCATPTDAAFLVTSLSSSAPHCILLLSLLLPPPPPRSLSSPGFFALGGKLYSLQTHLFRHFRATLAVQIVAPVVSQVYYIDATCKLCTTQRTYQGNS